MQERRYAVLAWERSQVDITDAAAVERVARWVGLAQQGRIAVYLLFSFLTLTVMLLLVKQ